LYQKEILNNGIRLIISNMPQVRSVSVALFIGTGGCYESINKAGISHFIEHLCFKGTAMRQSSREISEAIEGTGGSINGGTDKELTIYWCKVASSYLKLAIEVLNDIVRNSRFDNEDIENERKVIIEEINMNYDSPQQRVDTLIYELLWPDLPLGRDIAGKKDTVQDFKREELISFYKGHYLPNNSVISIAGDLETGNVMDILHQNFKDWTSHEVEEILPSYHIQNEPRIKIEYREIEQSHICLAFPGYSLLNPDRFAIDILNIILGDGMSSRLFVELREKRGLAYEVGSSVDHYKDTGNIIVHAGVDPHQVKNALSAMWEQLALIRTDVSETELLRAKELIKGRLFLAMENTRSVANWLGAQEVLLGEILTVDEITALVDLVTINDLRRVAQEIIVDNKINLAIVGPVAEDNKILDSLRL
jgi:predicted Zn-dependent peptidase